MFGTRVRLTGAVGLVMAAVAGVTTGAPVPTGAQVCEAEILIVAGAAPAPSGDRSLVAAVEAYGPGCVTVAAADDVSATRAEAFDLVVVTSSVHPDALGSRLRDAAVPILVSEPYLFDDMGFVAADRGKEYGTQASIRITDPSHPLAGGFSFDVPVYRTADALNIAFDGTAPGMAPVATTNPGSTRLTLFGFETGAELIGLDAPAGRVGFFVTYGAVLTDQGIDLVHAALDWLATQVVTIGADCDPLRLVPGADLRNCDLSGMDLSGVDLTGADLTGADLRGTTFGQVDLTGALLDAVDARGAHFGGGWGYPKLEGTTWHGADLRGAVLAPDEHVEWGRMSGAQFVAADLSGATLSGDMTGVSFAGSNLRDSDLTSSLQAYLDRCVGRPESAPVTAIDMTGVDATGAFLRGDFRDADFTGAVLVDLQTDGFIATIDCSDAWPDFGGALLDGVDLRGAHLAGVDLTGASLRGVDLSGARFTRDTWGRDPYLHDASLLDAIATADAFVDARWSNTECPDGTNSDDHPDGTCLANLDAAPTAVLVAGNTVPPSGDQPIVERLRSLGYTVTIVDDDSDLSAIDLAGVDVVLVSSSVVPSTVGDALADVPVPLITWEPYLYDDLGFQALPGGKGETPGRTGDVAEPSHPLVGGLGGGGVVLTHLASPLSYGRPEGDAEVALTAPGAPQRALTFTYHAGAQMATAPAPAPRVGLFMSYSTPRVLSAAGWTVFERALEWVASPDAVPAVFPSGSVTTIELGPSGATEGYVVEIDPVAPGADGDAFRTRVIPTWDGTTWIDVAEIVRVGVGDVTARVRVHHASWSEPALVRRSRDAAVARGDWAGFVLGPWSWQAGYVAEVSPTSPGPATFRMPDAAGIGGIAVQPEGTTAGNDVLRVRHDDGVPGLDMELAWWTTTSATPVVVDVDLVLPPTGQDIGWIIGPASDRAAYVVEVTPIDAPVQPLVHTIRVQQEFDGTHWNDVVRMQTRDGGGALHLRVYEIG